MRGLIQRLLAVFVLALPLPSFAVPFSNLYVLGDSVSDQGNLFIASSIIAGADNALPSPPPYFKGRFSNGPNYIDLVAQGLGIRSLPTLAGGNNFAFGGARTSYNTVESTVGGPFPPARFPWSLNAQTAAFLDRGINDPNALYLVFSGSNDVADILTRGLDPGTVISSAVTGVLAGVHAFRDAGAQIIVVPNIPDLGLTPAFVDSPGASAAATLFSAQFNTLLHAQLETISGVNIIEFDTFGFIRDAVSNPAAVGLSNVSDACYSGFVAPDATATTCPNPDDFLFWDAVHPTRAAHALLANQLLIAIPSGIPEPSSLPLLVLGIALYAGLRTRTTRSSKVNT